MEGSYPSPKIENRHNQGCGGVRLGRVGIWQPIRGQQCDILSQSEPGKMNLNRPELSGREWPHHWSFWVVWHKSCSYDNSKVGWTPSFSTSTIIKTWRMMENIYARGPQNTLLSCFAKTSKGHLSQFYAKKYTLYERLINCLTFKILQPVIWLWLVCKLPSPRDKIQSVYNVQCSVLTLMTILPF